MATPVMSWQRVVTPVAAAVVVGYLAVMVISGAQPTQRQFVAFEAKGLLKNLPEQIDRIELARADQHVWLIRQDEGRWIRPDRTEVDEATARQISKAVLMMHNSGPVREIPAGEISRYDPATFGLDAPRLTARFYASGADPVLSVQFGGRNPDDFLQYMRIDGDDHLYLMSRFIGEAWAGAFSGSLRP